MSFSIYERVIKISTTEKLRLTVIAPEEDMTVAEFIQKIAGTGSDEKSNFESLDDAYSSLQSLVTSNEGTNYQRYAELKTRLDAFSNLYQTLMTISSYDSDNAIADAGGIKAWLEANYEMTPKEVVEE